MNHPIRRGGPAGIAATVLLGVLTVTPASQALASTSTTASAPVPRSSTANQAAAKCSATGVPTTTRYLRQLPKVPQAKAVRILRAASACDSTTLIAIARKDQTRLSFGLDNPTTELAVPDRYGRYRALVIMFTRMKPTVERIGSRTTYTWPLLQVKPSAAAWREVVKVGLLTQKQADAMRRGGVGYLGWRTSVSPKGAWEFNVAGD